MTYLPSMLEQLTRTFTVKDIMVTEKELQCAHDKASALEFLQVNLQFDIAPIKKSGSISEYLERGSESPKPIGLHDIISDATSILEIVDILSTRKFCFVLTGQHIGGYIHFSDINNSLVKLPYFVLLEAIEQQLAKVAGSLIHEQNLNKVLDPQRTTQVIDRMNKLRKERADLGWENLLSFNELVRFACHFDKLQLKTKEVETISKVRNLVIHGGDPLVNSHNDVIRLADAKRICLQVLKSM